MPFAFNDYCYSSDDQAFDAYINKIYPTFYDGFSYSFVSAVKVSQGVFDVTFTKNDGINPALTGVQGVSFTSCDPLATEQNLTDLVGFFTFGFGAVITIALTAHALQAVLAMIQHKRN